MTQTIVAGRTRGVTGGWVRLKSAPEKVLIATVAHILFDSQGRLRSEVKLGAHRARVHSVVELPSHRSVTADAALIEPGPAWVQDTFAPAPGHLNSFVRDLQVRCQLPDGATMFGKLLRAGWAGRMSYTFGTRWVTGQWIVVVDHQSGAIGTRPLRRGDSGLLWSTLDGVCVGVQIGIRSGRPYEAIVTPFETVCQLFKVRVASD